MKLDKLDEKKVDESLELAGMLIKDLVEHPEKYEHIPSGAEFHLVTEGELKAYATARPKKTRQSR